MGASGRRQGWRAWAVPVGQAHVCDAACATQPAASPQHSAAHTGAFKGSVGVVWFGWVCLCVYACVKGKGAAVTAGAAWAHRAPCPPAHAALVPRAAPGAAPHTPHSQLATTADGGRVTAVYLQVLQLQCPQMAPLSAVSVPVLESQGCTAHVACKKRGVCEGWDVAHGAVHSWTRRPHMRPGAPAAVPVRLSRHKRLRLAHSGSQQRAPPATQDSASTGVPARSCGLACAFCRAVCWPSPRTCPVQVIAHHLV